MPCYGSGRYIIVRATNAATWDFFEAFAWPNEPLAINPTAVTLSGMTASPSNYDTLLFGSVYVRGSNYVTLQPDPLATEHKMTVTLATKDYVQYVWISIQEKDMSLGSLSEI